MSDTPCEPQYYNQRPEPILYRGVNWFFEVGYMCGDIQQDGDIKFSRLRFKQIVQHVMKLVNENPKDKDVLLKHLQNVILNFWDLDDYMITKIEGEYDVYPYLKKEFIESYMILLELQMSVERQKNYELSARFGVTF